MEDELQKLVDGQHSFRQALKPRERLVDGDHWLDGKGWIGPKPVQGHTKSAEVMGMIKDNFVFKNMILEVCRRHRDAVVGQEVSYGMTVRRPLKEEEEPSAEEQKLIDEAEAALKNWFDSRDVMQELQTAVLTSLWAAISPSRTVSPMRVFIPKQSLENGLVPQEDVPEVVKRLDFGALSPISGGVIRDNDKHPIAAYYKYKEGDNERLELWATKEVLEEHKLLTGKFPEPEDGDTVIQIRENGMVIEQASYEIGGRLPIVEIEREPLITEAIISQQKLLNLSMTMLGRNVVQGGFLERIITNAQLPGKWVDEDGNETPEGKYFKPDDLKVGAASTNFFAGMPYYDETGQVKGYTTPGVHYRDPVDVSTFKDTTQEAKLAIYEEAAQLHVTISGDATASGTSRVQATNDFTSSVTITGSRVEAAFREVLETVLSLAAFFSGSPGKFADLRATVTARVTATKPEPADIDSNIKQVDAGTMSKETAMQRNGIEDVKAEKERIKQEREEDIDYMAQEAGALAQFDNPGGGSSTQEE